MVKQAVEFAKDQKDIGTDLKYLFFNQNSPMRNKLWTGIAVILAGGFIWYHISQYSALKGIIEEQNTLISELRSNIKHETAVNTKQAKLSVAAVEEVARLSDVKTETDNRISELKEAYEKELHASNMLSNAIDKLKSTTIAEINYVNAISDINNNGNKEDKSKVVVITALSTVPATTNTITVPIPSKGDSKVAVPDKKKYDKKKPTTVSKVKKKPLEPKRVTTITDPLVGKTFASTKSYRQYWEDQLWETLEQV